MRKQKSRWRLLTAVLVVAGTAALLAQLLPRDRELSKVAIPVFALDTRNKTLLSHDNIIFGCPYYFYWLNDRDVLLGKTIDSAHWQLCRKKVLPAYNNRPLIPIPGVVLNYGECPIQPSPDERWMMVFDARGPTNWHTRYFPLNANAARPFHALPELQSLWTADSRNIVQFRGWPTSIEYTDRETNRTRKVLLTLSDSLGHLRYMQPVAISAANRLVMQYGGPQFDRQQNAIQFASKDPTRTSVCSFLEIDLNNLNAPTRTWDARIPPDADNGTAYLSPHLDKILWNVKCTEVSKLDASVRRIFPKWRAHPYEVVHWRVSRADGTGLQEVAHFRYNGKSPAIYPYPSWLPGGKQICFIRKDTLYVIPLD